MIPEVLKRLLQPWLKQIETDLLIEYIRQHSSDEKQTLSKLDDTLADDMPTVRLSEAEQSVEPSVFRVHFGKETVLNLSRF